MGELISEEKITDEIFCSLCKKGGKIEIQNLKAGNFYKLIQLRCKSSWQCVNSEIFRVWNIKDTGKQFWMLCLQENRDSRAKIRCKSKNCKRMYHFPCWFQKQHQFIIDNLDPNQDPEIYSNCKMHAFKQTRRKEAYQQENCLICQDKEDGPWKNPGPGLGRVVCNVYGYIFHLKYEFAITTGQHQQQEEKF